MYILVVLGMDIRGPGSRMGTMGRIGTMGRMGRKGRKGRPKGIKGRKGILPRKQQLLGLS